MHSQNQFLKEFNYFANSVENHTVNCQDRECVRKQNKLMIQQAVLVNKL